MGPIPLISKILTCNLWPAVESEFRSRGKNINLLALIQKELIAAAVITQTTANWEKRCFLGVVFI